MQEAAVGSLVWSVELAYEAEVSPQKSACCDLHGTQNGMRMQLLAPSDLL